jgi:hypothetical protein
MLRTDERQMEFCNTGETKRYSTQLEHGASSGQATAIYCSSLNQDSPWRMPSSGMSRREACIVLRLLVNLAPSSPILATLIMKAIRSSEASVLTRATRPHIPEDNIRRSHRHGNLKSYRAY